MPFVVETETPSVERSGETSLAATASSPAPTAPHLASLFRGRGEYAIDDKGRLTLPPQMRRPLVGAGGSLVVLDGRVVLWAEETYRAAVDHLNALVADGALDQQHVRNFLSSTHLVSPDTQGRIVVPHAVRVEAGLDRDVVVLGAGARIEIVPAGVETTLGLLEIDDTVVDALDRANF